MSIVAKQRNTSKRFFIEKLKKLLSENLSTLAEPRLDCGGQDALDHTVRIPLF